MGKRNSDTTTTAKNSRARTDKKENVPPQVDAPIAETDTEGSAEGTESDMTMDMMCTPKSDSLESVQDALEETEVNDKAAADAEGDAVDAEDDIEMSDKTDGDDSKKSKDKLKQTKLSLDLPTLEGCRPCTGDTPGAVLVFDIANNFQLKTANTRLQKLLWLARTSDPANLARVDPAAYCRDNSQGKGAFYLKIEGAKTGSRFFMLGVAQAVISNGNGTTLNLTPVAETWARVSAAIGTMLGSRYYYMPSYAKGIAFSTRRSTGKQDEPCANNDIDVNGLTTLPATAKVPCFDARTKGFPVSFQLSHLPSLRIEDIQAGTAVLIIFTLGGYPCKRRNYGKVGMAASMNLMTAIVLANPEGKSSEAFTPGTAIEKVSTLNMEGVPAYDELKEEEERAESSKEALTATEFY